MDPDTPDSHVQLVEKAIEAVRVSIVEQGGRASPNGRTASPVVGLGGLMAGGGWVGSPEAPPDFEKRSPKGAP